MFTGIVQDIGKVKDIKDGIEEIIFETSLDLTECKIGSSISCDGICLTVTTIQKLQNDNFLFSVNVGEETKKRTNALFWNKMSLVNLEKSMKMGDEISGHFVYGHVDTTFKITKIE